MRITKSVVFGLMSLGCTVKAIKANGKPVIAKRQAAVTVTNNGCTAVCEDVSNMDEGTQCEVYCSGGFSTSMPATSTATSVTTSTVTKAALNQRTVVSAVNGDCTAICWDLMPGTECDVQCSSDFKTKMPGNVAHLRGANGSHHLALNFGAQESSRPNLLPRSVHHVLTNGFNSTQQSHPCRQS